jgi:hypothetical protein
MAVVNPSPTVHCPLQLDSFANLVTVIEYLRFPGGGSGISVAAGILLVRKRSIIIRLIEKMFFCCMVPSLEILKEKENLK